MNEINHEIHDIKSLEEYVMTSESEVFSISRGLIKIDIKSREDSFKLKRVVEDNNVLIQ